MTRSETRPSAEAEAPREEQKRFAVGAAWPWKEIVVDGVRLTYADDGTGPTLVCLHAIGHGAGDFTHLRSELRKRCRVIALDWPGQGHSSDDHEPASAARYVELLTRFLDQLGIDHAILLGNSIGGAAAIRFAAAFPARVQALVLVNPGGLDRGGWLGRFFIAVMVRFFSAGAHGARWYPRAFSAYYRMVLRTQAAAAHRARITAAAAEIAPILVQAWRSFGEADADVRALLPAITCPVLVAWARQDRINQLSRCRAALDRLPNARLELFRAGHAPFLEAPGPFIKSLTDFLDGLPSPAAASKTTERRNSSPMPATDSSSL